MRYKIEKTAEGLLYNADDQAHTITCPCPLLDRFCSHGREAMQYLAVLLEYDPEFHCEAWVIEGEPRQGFEPHMKGAKYLSRFRGRVWIDKADLQLAKMDIEAIDTVALGWFIARVHKGTRVMLEQTRVNDEVWLPIHVIFRVDARVALLKGYNIDGEQTYRDYKKFRTTSKIVGIGEVQEPPK
jgi:hypothetical protein